MATSVTGDLELALLQFQRPTARGDSLFAPSLDRDAPQTTGQKWSRSYLARIARWSVFDIRLHHLMEKDREEASDAFESAREYNGSDHRLIDEISLESAYLTYDF